MKNLSKFSVLLLVVLFVAIGAGNALAAGKYPEKPITVIVHAGAGGGSDIFARTMAAALRRTSFFPSRSSSRTSRAEAAESPSPMWPARRRTPTTSLPRSRAF